MSMKILEVKIVKTESEKVLARADIHFEGFWLKGFKVIKGKEANKEYVTPPSYKAGPYWRELFHTDNQDDWQEIHRRILQDYNIYLMNQTIEEN